MIAYLAVAGFLMPVFVYVANILVDKDESLRYSGSFSSFLGIGYLRAFAPVVLAFCWIVVIPALLVIGILYTLWKAFG